MGGEAGPGGVHLLVRAAGRRDGPSSRGRRSPARRSAPPRRPAGGRARSGCRPPCPKSVTTTEPVPASCITLGRLGQGMRRWGRSRGGRHEVTHGGFHGSTMPLRQASIVNVDQVNIDWVNGPPAATVRRPPPASGSRWPPCTPTSVGACCRPIRIRAVGAACSRSVTLSGWPLDSAAARKVESRLATVTTSVTQLREGGPFYRGQAATELAARSSYEEVAALLWAPSAESEWPTPELGPCPLVRVADRMSWALLMSGAGDPLRADLRPEAVTRAARRVVAALVTVVGEDPFRRPRSLNRSPRGWPGVWADRRSALSGRGGQCRLDPDGRSRAGHLHPGRSGGRLNPGRYLRRAVGRAGHTWPARCTAWPASRPTTCWCRRNEMARRRPSTTGCAGSAPARFWALHLQGRRSAV